ncbi:MAG: glycosyltransferase family 4 protein [Rubrimonas sp.]|uniref:glycosyltransferase family 4 protein n=1 Tax=Rubrimonas sp. TaxID=2036015 RepID=UPI002FDCD8AA
MLQVLPRLDVGGVERGALEVARAVAAAGGRALVASEGGRLAARLALQGAEHVPGPFASKNPLTIWRNAGRLAQLIVAEGVDVVHARSRAPAWSALLAARRTARPFVTTWHGVYSESGPFKRLYNSVMAKGRPTIAISEFIRDLIVARHGLDPALIEVIPRGADLGAFAEELVSAERAIAVARDWGIVEDPRPVVLLPARLSRWKGQSAFVEAAALLKARRGAADFLFVLVGGGADSDAGEALLAQARARDALDVVRLGGLCEDMPAAYKLASVVVSASTEPEAFGRTPVEAQAMGRPVIATDHGGARETVAHGRTGWLVPPGDAAALADAADAALSLDASARAHMAAAGRARVAQLFTVAEMQRRTLAVYERVAGRSFGAGG